MNVTVYLGANYGTDPALQTTVAELGQWMAKAATRWSTAALPAA